MRADTRQTLVTALAKARLWWLELASRSASDTAAIAARKGTAERHIRMALPLALLAPDVMRAVLEGRLLERHGTSKAAAQATSVRECVPLGCPDGLGPSHQRRDGFIDVGADRHHGVSTVARSGHDGIEGQRLTRNEIAEPPPHSEMV